jgi:hypothetical protein
VKPDSVKLYRVEVAETILCGGVELSIPISYFS